MVSKIAVIALVAIVACPILIGYAMNLNEVTVTDYKESGESVNVTPLYQNGIGYTYTNADTYSLNTKFLQGYSPKVSVMPEYQKTTTSSTSIPTTYTGEITAGNYPGEVNDFIGLEYYYYQSNYQGDNSGYLSVTLYDASWNPSGYQNRIHSFYYDDKKSNVSITYYPDSSGSPLLSFNWANIDNTWHFQITNDSGLTYTSNGYLSVAIKPEYQTRADYVDLAGGFKLTGFQNILDNSLINDSKLNNNKVVLDLPDYPNNVLLTMDLNTITDSSYDMIFELQGYGIFTEIYTLRKTTDSEGIHFEVYRGRPMYSMNKVMDLYYDSSRLSNTYQMYIDNTGMEFRYVGNWPTIIGAANVYQTFRYDRDYSYYIGGLKDLSFWNKTPVMRVDSSEYRAFEYPIIENQTYTPYDFKTNPSTKITGDIVYGRSLTFGSNTYTVTDGNITMGTHKVPVKGMILDSIPNDHGSYDNRINGTKVSESANPATITFNGKWSANIITTAQESYTYTKTEWVAGSFGWDGMDHNFLLVGLITSFGVFVALGIYARRSRSGGLIPLMIVTGCASVLFFIML